MYVEIISKHRTLNDARKRHIFCKQNKNLKYRTKHLKQDAPFKLNWYMYLVYSSSEPFNYKWRDLQLLTTRLHTIKVIKMWTMTISTSMLNNIVPRGSICSKVLTN